MDTMFRWRGEICARCAVATRSARRRARSSRSTSGSSFTIPIVGGWKTFATATGGDQEDTTAGGTVPATLSLTVGAPASFPAFTPGVAKEYTATTTARVVSTAGDAALAVADPSPNNTGHLVNGAFALPQALQGLGVVKTWSAPTSNEDVTVTFKQAIGQTTPCARARTARR